MPESEKDTAARVQAWAAEARQAWAAEDFTRARQLFEQVLAAWRARDQAEELIFPLIHVTQAMRFEPGYDPAAARPLLDEALTLAEQAGIAQYVAAVQMNVAVLALEQGEYPTALALAQQLLAQSLQSSDLETWGLLCHTGLALAGLGLHEEALRLYAAGTALRERQGIEFNVPAILRQHARMLAGARAALGPERQASVEAEGHVLPVDRAVEQALALTAPRHVQNHATTSDASEGNAD